MQRRLALSLAAVAAATSLVCGARFGDRGAGPDEAMRPAAGGPGGAARALDPIDAAWQVALASPPPDTTPGYQVPYRRRNKRPLRSFFAKYPYNPVLGLGPHHGYDSGHAEYPSVIDVGDSLLMAYAAFGAGGHWSIASASSLDGIHWTKHGVVLEPDSTAGAWDGATNAFPSLVHVPEAPPDERFRLYYAGKGGELYDGIGLAVSADGIHWRRAGRVLAPGGSDEWDGMQIVDPSVVRAADGYRLYYCGSRTRSGLFAVGVAFSADGKQWVKYPDNPVYALDRSQGRGVYTVDVIEMGDAWLLFESTPDSDGFYDVFGTLSPDGLAFDARRRRVVLSASHDGTWDHVMVYGVDALVRGGSIYVWFNGIYRKMVTRGGQVGLARAGRNELRAYLDRQ